MPDLYQGSEIMDLGLVDPDNRRPVDFALRARLLDEISAGADAAAQAMAFAQTLHDGRAKLHVTARLLALRRELPDLFRLGSYVPLTCSGTQAAHVLAYARQHEGRTLVVIGGRLFAKLLREPRRLPLGSEIWTDTTVVAADLREGARLVNVLTGETVPVSTGGIPLSHAFADFPAAALISAT